MSIKVGVLGFAHGHVNAYLTQWKARPELDVSVIAGWDHDPGRLQQNADAFGFRPIPDAAALLAGSLDNVAAREEIFGPVLSVMQVGTFAEALELANATSYKLTGGVFSRKPAHLESARRQFRVGNLYLNRGITGALVGRQPFGGFGLSGVGSKAGGADYLLHFVEPRSSCENTMRHGFAPGLD